MGKVSKEQVKYFWKKIYAFVIPTFFAVLYLVLYVCHRKDIIKNSVMDSANTGNLLEGIITFVTIVMSIFGFLLPVLVTNKKDCGMVEFFLQKADKSLFVSKLKKLVISGMIAVLLCLLLFLEDILAEELFEASMVILIWFLLYFVCNAYRFIGLILSLLIMDKNVNREENQNAVGKQVKNSMSAEDIERLNQLLKQDKSTP